MLVDEEMMQIEKEYTNKQLENNSFHNPGSSYLQILKYYFEEKDLVTKENNYKTWEGFIEKYFSHTVEMEVNIFENQKLFYKIDANYGNMGYIYFHKNKSILNKFIFINDHEETTEKDEFNNELKVIKVKNGLDVCDYRKNKVFIYFDAICKFNFEMKFQYVSIRIDKIQLFDEVNFKTLDLFELKSHIFSVFSIFKNFMTELTHLISDLNFLDMLIGDNK